MKSTANDLQNAPGLWENASNFPFSIPQFLTDPTQKYSPVLLLICARPLANLWPLQLLVPSVPHVQQPVPCPENLQIEIGKCVLIGARVPCVGRAGLQKECL